MTETSAGPADTLNTKGSGFDHEQPDEPWRTKEQVAHEYASSGDVLDMPNGHPHAGAVTPRSPLVMKSTGPMGSRPV